MIISHKHKYIFVKAQKVAGTSVQDALAKECGPNDIVIGRGTDNGSKYGLNEHSTPKAIKNFVGDDVFNAYRKIVIVRNPWDMFVSLYFHAHKSVKILCPMYFEDFIKWNLDGAYPMNENFWIMNGR